MFDGGVTIITCTGARPEAIKLCGRMLARQSYRGPMHWLVVDDCGPPTADLQYAEGISTTIVRPEPRWKTGQNTQRRNLTWALNRASMDDDHDKILFVEDDDYIAPDYVEFMARMLGNGTLLAGEQTSNYYHLPTRKYRTIHNNNYASLGQTIIHRSLAQSLIDVCGRGGPIDQRFWRLHLRDNHGLLFSVKRSVGGSSMVIGMKGLPGRPGIGIGHCSDFYRDEDHSGEMLRRWIGDDAQWYEDILADMRANDKSLLINVFREQESAL